MGEGVGVGQGSTVDAAILHNVIIFVMLGCLADLIVA